LASRAGTFQLIRGLFTPEEIRELVHPDIWEAGHGVTGIMSTVERALKDVQLDAVQEVAVAEQCTYMRNQLLRDADWASMKHSLEVRLPLVDRPVTESLGPALPLSRAGGKKSLAQALHKPLPDAVLRRRKTGFALPMQEWVGEDIAAGKLLSPSRELLHPDGRAAVDRLHAGVPGGRTHWSRPWALHCLASWLQTVS
jgi:asparagine synthase (glutamine-hydrolysing)